MLGYYEWFLKANPIREWIPRINLWRGYYSSFATISQLDIGWESRHRSPSLEITWRKPSKITQINQKRYEESAVPQKPDTRDQAPNRGCQNQGRNGWAWFTFQTSTGWIRRTAAEDKTDVDWGHLPSRQFYVWNANANKGYKKRRYGQKYVGKGRQDGAIAEDGRWL